MIDAAYRRLINMRRHGSRLRKVIAKRAMKYELSPEFACELVNDAVKTVKADQAWKRMLRLGL